MDKKPRWNKHAILPALIGALLIILSLTAGIFVTKYTDKFRFPEIFISAPGKHVLWCRIGSEENPKMIL